MSQAQTVQGITATGILVPIRVDTSGQVYIANPGSGGAAGNLATAAKGTTAAGSPTSTTASADRQPLDVTLRDTAGNAVAVGGGTQYTDGAVTGTPTGTVMMVDDGTNIQSAKGDAAGRLDVNVNGTVPVSGTFFQATQPVSGTVTANTGLTQPLTDTQLRAAAVPVSGTITVNTIPAVETGLAKDVNIGIVTETAPATDTASSGLNGRMQRIAQRLTSLIALLPAALGAGGGLKVDGSGTALPVSGTVSTGLSQPLTDTQLRATPVPVSGTVSTGGLTDTQLRASALPVSSTDTTTSGTIALVSQSVALALNGKSGVAIQITGTWVGTLQFEGTVDGTNWVTINGVVAGTSTPGTTTIANGIVRVTPSGLAQVRITSTVWTSGTATISMRASDATGGTFLNQSLTAGNNTIGNVNVVGTVPVSLAVAPTTPVTGTFFQATQPVSLATNTPTLQSGSTTAVTQATAANLNAQTAQIATVIPTATTMQNAAVAVGNGTNLNVLGYVSAIISITGTMGGGTRIDFEASVDDVTFVSIAGHQIGVTGNLGVFTTSTGDFRFSLAAYKSIRARISTYGTGTITAKGYVSAVAGHGTTVNANIIAALPTGTNTIGNVGIIGTVPVSLATAPTTPVTGTFFQATQPVSLATAPTTPVTGTFFQATQPVSLATNTPVIAAGTALIGKVGIDQTTPGTTNNVALQPSNLLVTATAAISTAATLTLPAVAGQFHYITSINIHKYAGVAVVGAAAPVLVTSTNLPGSLAWTTPTAQAVGTSYDVPFNTITPIKSSVANTATTIVCPLTTSVIWRITVTYYTAA